MSVDPKNEPLGTFLGYWILAIVFSLLNFLAVVLLSFILNRPGYRIPLHDGTLFAFATVTSSIAFMAYYRDVTRPNRPLERPWIGPMLLAGGLVIPILAMSIYTATVFSRFYGIGLSSSAEVWFGSGLAIAAATYGLGSELARRYAMKSEA